MRIDYSEPRQSSGSGNSALHSQRKMESSRNSPNLLLITVLACIVFSVGFTTGWYLSQQSAKKAFRAAMEQQSLESNSKKQPEQPQQQLGQTQQTAAVAATPGPQPQQASPTGQVPLSFFENLPKGQKQAVLGSGINEKPKPAQPAAPPTHQQTVAKTAEVKTVGSAGYLVQVAAFTSSKEAEATKVKLSAKGYSASVVEINLNDKGIWYRVRIGRHLDKDAATEIVNRLGGSAKILPDQE
jgi:cell division protein FtsN